MHGEQNIKNVLLTFYNYVYGSRITQSV